MDERVERRFHILFDLYERGDTPLVEFAKERIAEQQRQHPRLSLRSDAALFMLTNLDYMLIRPFAVKLPLQEDDQSALVSIDEMSIRLAEHIALLFDELESRAGDSTTYVVSSRDVIATTGDIWDRVASAYCPWY